MRPAPLPSSLGAQIDGRIAVAGHTLVCGVKDQPATGRRADVICAANAAAHVVQALLNPGTKVCFGSDERCFCCCDFSFLSLPSILFHRLDLDALFSRSLAYFFLSSSLPLTHCP